MLNLASYASGTGTTQTYQQLLSGGYGGRIGGGLVQNVGPIMTFNVNSGGPVSEVFRIQNTNVGIGTTNPNAMLDVNGAVRAAGGFVSKTGGSSGTTSSFTFAPPNSSGHAILSISTVGSGYWFGYLFWTSGLSSFISVPIVNSAVTVSANSTTLLCTITSTSSGHRWNLTYFPVPDNGNTNNIY